MTESDQLALTLLEVEDEFQKLQIDYQHASIWKTKAYMIAHYFHFSDFSEIFSKEKMRISSIFEKPVSSQEIQLLSEPALAKIKSLSFDLNNLPDEKSALSAKNRYRVLLAN